MTWLLSSNSIEPILTKITNFSLSSGEVHLLLKEEVITPSLKKFSLDSEVMNNFQPISNLPYLSKVINRVVATQYFEHYNTNNISNPHQSAYCKHFSMETVLTCVHNDVFHANSGVVSFVS